MNQEKIGNFISERRKSKKITQEKIAKKLGITCQSISKWERGVNLPDISFLKDLAKILDVSVEELLQGELNENSNPKCSDEIIVNGIEFYEKKVEKKYKIKMIVIITLFLVTIVSILFTYYFNNYNKIKIYTINSTNDNVDVSGMFMFYPKNNLFLLSDIEYNDQYTSTSKEIKARNLKVEFYANNKKLIEYKNNNYKDNELKNINLLIDEIFKNNIIKIENKNLTKEEIENLKIIISFIDKNNDLNKIEVPLNLNKKFSNDCFFYK